MFGLPARLNGDVDVIRVLSQPDEFGAKPHFGEPALSEQRQCGANELVLFPLQHERIRHLAFKEPDIEGGDKFVAGAIAKVKDRRLKAARGIFGESLLFETEIGEHFQSRRVDRRGALILDRLGLGFQEQHRNAFAHQSERHDGADRPGADDDHALVAAGHDGHTLAISNIEG